MISSRAGDSEKTPRAHYAKYIEDVDNSRTLIEASIIASENEVKTLITYKLQELLAEGQEIKKPSISQGLKDGAGEEGRTPDLMLGKHTL